MHTKINKPTLFVLLLSIFYSACGVSKQDSLIKSQNGSSYSYRTVKTSSQNLPVISATVFEQGTNFPLVVSHLNLDVDKNKTFGTDSTKIVFTVQPGTHTLDAWWMGYLHCETKTFNTSTGDTLHFKFYLKPDTKPLTQPIVQPNKKTGNN
ncbi:hypothetical protein IDJ75_17350 [Mucilaginibacter rigui]|uniref:Lipoprotein n=1 Tax=Mucilaginibacter rigui TaxID=534635 RepID=A0ABR7X952_9SPHI|nr:hypothetical protein [Mucilaginibacter rigui]MBD1387056.1 hypothetical protein [Mucilaginibacter rigui]